MHPRHAIRSAVVAAVARVAALGGRVKATRLEPPVTADLPVGTVLTVDETSTADTTTKRLRATRFQVSATIVATDTVDADLDALAEAIEAEIAGDADLRRLTISTLLTETRFDIRTEAKDGTPLAKPIARIGLVYTATHRTTPAGVAA